MKNTVLALLISTVLSFSVKAQLTVDTAIDPLTLNAFLTGFGMSITNLSVSCDPGSIGTFVSNGSNIGMTDGLALSSGRVADMPGPNDNTATSSDMGGTGDTDLDMITGFGTYDACVVEFDCVPQFNLLQFNFVFGSEEYLEFANTGFNDVFAIFINGPGFPVQENIALIPGTTMPVTIDDVNDIDNPSFYVDNGDGASPPQNTDPMVIQYDGFTTNLIGEAFVQPGQTYHLKFAVADVGDHVYDSGVMIEANSVRSSPSTSISHITNGSNASVNWDPNRSDHVLVRHTAEPADISIVDMWGRTIRTWDSFNHEVLELNSNGLNHGSYILVLEAPSGPEVLRFVK